MLSGTITGETISSVQQRSARNTICQLAEKLQLIRTVDEAGATTTSSTTMTKAISS